MSASSTGGEFAVSQWLLGVEKSGEVRRSGPISSLREKVADSSSAMAVLPPFGKLSPAATGITIEI
jgi:hypothetical protein